jgi:hypothetical protein
MKTHITQLLADPKLLPQCEALRVNRYFNDKKNTDYRCVVRAKYKIHGQYLCAKHAAPLALELLLQMQAQDDGRTHQMCFGCVDGHCTNNCWSSKDQPGYDEEAI